MGFINTSVLAGGGVLVGQAVFMEEDQPTDLVVYGKRYLQSGNIETDDSLFDTSIFTAKTIGTLTSRTSQFGSSNITAVVHGNNLFVAAGASGKISTSTDGETWVARTPPHSAAIVDAAFGVGLFVTLATGELWTSPDGVNWTSRVSGFGSNTALTIDFVNNRFLATAVIGGATRVASSLDGIAWTLETQSITGVCNGIAFQNDIYILLTSDGNAHISSDALTWVANPDAALNNGTDISAGRGNFLVSTSDGKSAISEDGVTWTAGNPSTSVALVAHIDGLFLICGNNERVDISPDGIDPWTNVNSGVGGSYKAMTSGNGTLVIAGDSGSLLSADIYNYAGSTVAHSENGENQYIRIS